MKLMKVLTAISILFGVMMAGNSAYATTPANALLKNSASLTYTGAPSPLTASVTVTVQLVRAAAVINGSAPTDVTLTENQEYTQTYKITAQANGPDEYSAAVAGSPTNLTGSTAPSVVVKTGGPTGTTEPSAGFILGATALAVPEVGTTGDKVVRVPDDNTPGAGGVNGLVPGDVVVFDGSPTEYIIDTITYPSGTDQAEITFTTASPDVPANAIGTGIFEVAEITTTVSSVGTTNGATPKVDVTLTVKPTDAGAPAGTTFTDVVTVNVQKLEFIKYVRNVTQDDAAGAPADCTANSGFSAAPAGATITFGTKKYCSKGVEASPGDILEYYIKVSNTGSAALAAVTLADVLDEFTTYSLGTTAMNGTDVTDASADPKFPLNASNGGGLKLQSGAFTTAEDGSGIIAATTGTSEVIYRVTVNNLNI